MLHVCTYTCMHACCSHDCLAKLLPRSFHSRSVSTCLLERIAEGSSLPAFLRPKQVLPAPSEGHCANMESAPLESIRAWASDVHMWPDPCSYSPSSNLAFRAIRSHLLHSLLLLLLLLIVLR